MSDLDNIPGDLAEDLAIAQNKCRALKAKCTAYKREAEQVPYLQASVVSLQERVAALTTEAKDLRDRLAREEVDCDVADNEITGYKTMAMISPVVFGDDTYVYLARVGYVRAEHGDRRMMIVENGAAKMIMGRTVIDWKITCATYQQVIYKQGDSTYTINFIANESGRLYIASTAFVDHDLNEIWLDRVDYFTQTGAPHTITCYLNAKLVRQISYEENGEERTRREHDENTMTLRAGGTKTITTTLHNSPDVYRTIVKSNGVKTESYVFTHDGNTLQFEITPVGWRAKDNCGASLAIDDKCVIEYVYECIEHIWKFTVVGNALVLKTHTTIE